VSRLGGLDDGFDLNVVEQSVCTEYLNIINRDKASVVADGSTSLQPEYGSRRVAVSFAGMSSVTFYESSSRIQTCSILSY
jgi:hypothetical protein